MSDTAPLRLLIVGLNYAPEQVGIGPYSSGLAETLAERGHTVEVVAGEAYYPEWHRHPNQPPSGTHHLENGVGIRRVKHYIPARPGGLKRILHLASFALSALVPAIRTARKLRPNVIFTVAPSALSVPSAWLAARLSGAKLWLHIQDFEVEAAFATGLLKQRGIGAGLARALENGLLKIADRVSTISPQMITKLHEKGVAPERTFELRNWANARFLPDASQAARYRTEWKLEGKKIALYSGNIANKQGIEIIIDAAQNLSERNDLVFVICGQGPNKARLEQLASGLDNVQLHDLQPAEQVGGLLALADVHLLPQIPQTADLVLPSKLTNMLLSGRPTVATAAKGTGLADEVEGCGITTDPGDTDAFAKAIADLLDDPVQAAEMGARASVRAAERWERDTIIHLFEAELIREARGELA